MEQDKLRRTLIADLQYDNKFSDYKDKLYPIISRSSINCIPKWDFATRPNQHFENVEIRIPIPLINRAKDLEEVICGLVRYVYEEDDEYALKDVIIRPQIISPDFEEEKSNSVEFDKIQDILIQGIRDAKYLIWVAVAWFSNDVLYQELVRRKQAGIHIRVIVSDEDSNKKLLPKIKENFECVVVRRMGTWGTNRMHDKFCIVDLDYVMHGSYNWTNAANYNNETLVTTVDHNLVKNFADEFMKLYSENMIDVN